MLSTKTNHFWGERNIVSVFTDTRKYWNGKPKLLGFVERNYFPEDGSYTVTLSEASWIKFGRFPRKIRVNSIQNGLKVLIQAEGKIK